MVQQSNLEDILNLNIPAHVKATFERSFNKMIYFNDNGKTRVGKLVGVYNNQYLIHTSNNDYSSVPFYVSLFLIC